MKLLGLVASVINTGTCLLSNDILSSGSVFNTAGLLDLHAGPDSSFWTLSVTVSNCAISL